MFKKRKTSKAVWEIIISHKNLANQLTIIKKQFTMTIKMEKRSPEDQLVITELTNQALSLPCKQLGSDACDRVLRVINLHCPKPK